MSSINEYFVTGENPVLLVVFGIHGDEAETAPLSLHSHC